MKKIISKKHIFVCLVLILLTGIYYFGSTKIKKIKADRDEKSKTVVKMLPYENQEVGLKLSYPENMTKAEISTENNEKGLLLRLLQVNPPLLITIWQETGLGFAETLVKKSILEYLKGNIDKNFSINYNDYKKEKIEDGKLTGLDSFSVWFTFQDKTKNYREKIKLSIVVKDKTAYYFQCMAPEDVWYQSEPDCDTVKDNFELVAL